MRPSLAELAEELEDHLAGVRVEVAGRFVGEDDLGIVDQRAGDGDALLLAAGKLAWAGACCGSPGPTSFSASMARSRRSRPETPL